MNKRTNEQIRFSISAFERAKEKLIFILVYILFIIYIIIYIINKVEFNQLDRGIWFYNLFVCSVCSLPVKKEAFEWYGRIYQKVNEIFIENSEESTRLRGRILWNVSSRDLDKVMYLYKISKVQKTFGG